MRSGPTRLTFLAGACTILALACAQSHDLPDGSSPAGQGGSVGSTGGARATGGSSATGGATASGGTLGSGGTATGGSVGSGGTRATGGTTGSGGTLATGGSVGTGGTRATGGTTGSGGTVATGGSVGSGGNHATGGSVGSGGTLGTGGTRATGGTTGSGGTVATGGTTGTGGTVATGGTSGGGPCTWSSGPSSNSGEITCYSFGQGTAKGGGCSSYKTYCGYCGTESGSKGSGICPSGITDTVPNTANSYFAAFPSGTFGQGKYCGMCVDVTWNGKTITATIVDECATCPSSNHIDLSLSAAAALGLGQGSNTGDATSGVTWKAVDCPVSGNIVAAFNNGNSGQVYFQNVVFPVAKAVAGGHTANQSYGYWDFGASVGGQSVTLTDTVGHVITGTLPTSSGGSVGAQFPMTCQ